MVFGECTAGADTAPVVSVSGAQVSVQVGGAGAADGGAVSTASVVPTAAGSEAPLTAAVGTPIIVSLPVGVATDVSFLVQPQASCTLNGHRLEATDNGVIHVELNVTQAATGNVPLVCTPSDGGAPLSYEVDLTGTADASAIAVTQAASEAIQSNHKVGTLRPALTGDPMSYTAAELFAQGYGTRPDPVAMPAAYAAWVDSVSVPVTMVPSRAVPSGISNNLDINLNIGGGLSDGPNEIVNWQGGPGQTGWSGIVDTYAVEDYSQFSYANTEFYVPQAFAESGIGPYKTSASTWSGIGGVGPNTVTLWQAGTEEDTSTDLYVQQSSYSAWWESPQAGSANTIPNMTIGAGDDVQSLVGICAPGVGFNYNLSADPNACLCVFVWDKTRSEQYWQYPYCGSAIPGGDTYTQFQTAEIIQEWNNGGSEDYSAFDPFVIGVGTACTTGLTGNVQCTPSEPSGYIGMGSYNDPFVPQTWAIGTGYQNGQPINAYGQACIGTIINSSNWECDDATTSPRLLVWWYKH